MELTVDERGRPGAGSAGPALMYASAASSARPVRHRVERPRPGGAAQQPTAAAAPADTFVINDGIATKTYNHLGNPANGILTAETWAETGWIVGDDFVPRNTQGALLLVHAGVRDDPLERQPALEREL